MVDELCASVFTQQLEDDPGGVFILPLHETVAILGLNHIMHSGSVGLTQTIQVFLQHLSS